MTIYKTIIKPIVDTLAACFGFLLLFPVFAIIWIILMFKNNGKAFFYQKRPGKNERIFKIIKFKTMNDKTDGHGELLPAKQRLTKTGIFIRKYSLDEIPQLINVLKGDMSLVGPRPLLMEYLALYNENQKKRHKVKPGITGWAQVNGWRGDTCLHTRISHDLDYIRRWSLWLDLKIICMTVFKGFINRNAY